MVRPNRLYKTKDKKVRYYYIVKGKRRYIKVPPTMSQRQVVKINIKNVLSEGRRIKRRKKRVLVKYEKPIVKEMQKIIVPSQAPVYFFQPEKKIVNVAEESLKQKTKDAEKKSYDDLEKITKKLEADTKENQKNIKDLIDNLTLSKFKQITITPDPEVTDSEEIEPTFRTEEVEIIPEEEINADIVDRFPIEIAKPEQKKVGRKAGNKNLTEDEKSMLGEMVESQLNKKLTNDQKYAIGLLKGGIQTENIKTIKEIAKELSLPNYQSIQSRRGLYDTLLELEDRKSRSMEKMKERISASSTPYSSVQATPLRDDEDDAEYATKVFIEQDPFTKKLQSLLKRNLVFDERVYKDNRPVRNALTNDINKLYKGLSGFEKIPLSSTETYEKWSKKINDIFTRLGGKGSSIKEGLYNDQIENVLKKRIRDFVPVIPSDKTSELLNYVQPNMKRFGFIINTNPSTSDGSGNDGYREGHWRSCFINNEDDFTSIEYFDPLASGNPEKSLIDSMKQIAKKMNPEKYFLLKINRLKRQPNGSASCGWHAIQFLDKRFQSIPWDEATGYNRYIEKISPSDTKNGEKEVKKYFEKYKSYI